MLPSAAVDTGETVDALARVSHIHLFGIAFIFFFVGYIFNQAVGINVLLKSALIFTPFAFLLLDVLSWWLTKWYPNFAILTLIGVSATPLRPRSCCLRRFTKCGSSPERVTRQKALLANVRANNRAGEFPTLAEVKPQVQQDLDQDNRNSKDRGAGDRRGERNECNTHDDRQE